MTKIIGLTGGIGSGKTTVAKLFAAQGIPVYIADEEARKITDDEKIATRIVDVFGEAVLDCGKIDRKKLASIVFNGAEKLEKLNAIIHPAVREHFKEWVRRHENHPFVVKEAAILFETGNNKDCDVVITVIAPIEVRIERVMARDNITRDEIVKRIENQWSDEKRISNSDFVISNTNRYETERQVNKILKKLKII